MPQSGNNYKYLNINKKCLKLIQQTPDLVIFAQKIRTRQKETSKNCAPGVVPSLDIVVASAMPVGGLKRVQGMHGFKEMRHVWSYDVFRGKKLGHAACSSDPLAQGTRMAYKGPAGGSPSSEKATRRRRRADIVLHSLTYNPIAACPVQTTVLKTGRVEWMQPYK